MTIIHYQTQQEQFGVRPTVQHTLNNTDDEVDDFGLAYHRYLELHDGRVYSYEIHRDNDHGTNVEPDGTVAHAIRLDVPMLAAEVNALLDAWADRLERCELSSLDDLYDVAGFNADIASARFSDATEIDWGSVETALHAHFDSKLPEGWRLGGDESFAFVAPDGAQFGEVDLHYWTLGGWTSWEQKWVDWLEEVLATEVARHCES